MTEYNCCTVSMYTVRRFRLDNDYCRVSRPYVHRGVRSLLIRPANVALNRDQSYLLYLAALSQMKIHVVNYNCTELFIAKHLW